MPNIGPQHRHAKPSPDTAGPSPAAWRSLRRAAPPARGLMPCARTLALTLVLALAMLGGMATAGSAQQIVVMVNGDPVTSYDVVQRQRLNQIIYRKTIGPKEALDELIDDRIKIQQARRMTSDLEEKDIDRMYASMAERSGRTADQLTQGLAQAGLDARAFKQKLAADQIWSQYVRSRSGNVIIRDVDVVAALRERGTTQMVATEYILRPIIFVVPRNGGNHGARLAEANALRARFTSCDSGIEAAKGLKEVVVRPQVSRISSEMPAALRSVLDKTEVGRLTPPEVTQTGVETFAICDKREVRGESAQKREIKDELSNSQFAAESKKLLNELRKQALIQYRR